MEKENIIQKVIEEKLIKLDLNVSEKEEAIRELADILFNNGKLISKEDYIKDVLKREKYCTTGIGCQIAIPHSTSYAVKETSIAVGRFVSPIEWSSLDGKPVSLVFLVAIRKNDTEKIHLKLLSYIATQLMEDEMVKSLLNAKTPERVIALLSGKGSCK